MAPERQRHIGIPASTSNRVTARTNRPQGRAARALRPAFARQSTRSSAALSPHHPAKALISSCASGSFSNHPIAASSPSKLASDSGCTALGLLQGRGWTMGAG